MKNSKDIDYYILLTLLLLIISTFLFKAFSQEYTYSKGIITKCIDGDTLKIVVDNDIIKTVRVLGVDTMESRTNKQAMKQAITFDLSLDTIILIGQTAKQLCIENWQGKEVNLRCWKKDKYKRDLCFVYDENNNDFGDYMIKNKVGYYVKPY